MCVPLSFMRFIFLISSVFFYDGLLIWLVNNNKCLLFFIYRGSFGSYALIFHIRGVSILKFRFKNSTSYLNGLNPEHKGIKLLPGPRPPEPCEP